MKNLFFFLVIMSSFSAFSQEDAIVYFNSKPNSAAFFASPSTELSARSLARRTAQNIALNLTDAPMSTTFIAQVTAASGIEVLAKSKWLNCVYVRGLQSNIHALTSLSCVQSISFMDPSLSVTANIPNNTNSKQKTKNNFQPINKVFNNLTTFNYGNSFNQIHMMNGEILHQQNYTGTGKIIAVLDAGFPGVDTAAPFQRLLTNNQILGGYDFVNKSSNVYSGDSHGTLVLSCMGGFKDGQLVGTAPDAKYYLYITEDVASENPVEEANWLEAAEEADRVGADVITSSLGYFGYDNPAYSHDYSDMTGNKNLASKAVNLAFAKGILVVASAGNAGSTAEPHVGVPAEATNALAIGAVNSARVITNFSSIGPSFDNRIKPDLMAQGQNSVLSNTAGTITTANGTSFSGPILAGMITSFWQAVPTLTNQQVVDLVKQSSDNFATPNEFYGYGIPNFQLALSNALPTENFYATNLKSFLIAPNPATDSIEISFPNDHKNATLLIFNNLGQTILNQDISETNSKIYLNNLNLGVYFYKIESTNYSQSGKIIKN